MLKHRVDSNAERKIYPLNGAPQNRILAPRAPKQPPNLAGEGSGHQALKPRCATDWSEATLEELQEGISTALNGGAAQLALQIAQAGIQRFPDNARFARITRLLAPPKVRIIMDEPKYDMEPCHSWLRRHGHLYRGQWVAIHQGRLLADGVMLKDVQAAIDPQIDTRSILMTRVLP